MGKQKLNILIADDDPEDLFFLIEELMAVKPDLELETVSDGQAALDYLRSKEPEELPALVILDYRMPLLTGLEVLSHLCKDERFVHVPVIMLSTSNNQKDIEDCKNMGALEYFVKPATIVDYSSLAQKLIKLMRS